MQMLKKFLLKKILSYPFKSISPKYVGSRLIGMHTIQGLLFYKSEEQQTPQISLYGGKHFGLIVNMKITVYCYFICPNDSYKETHELKLGKL